MHRVRFEVTGTTVVPAVDGTSLTELVDRFELAVRMDPAGDVYGGLPLRAVVPFDAHFLGGSATHGTRVPLLGCSCGDLGCWPLLAHVGVADGRVVWDSFEQPFRPDRDYDRFGPFRFDLRQYRDALAEPGAP